MKYIIRNKETQEIIKELNSFPTQDKANAIVGIDYTTQEIFKVILEAHPTYDANKSKLEKTITYSSDLVVGYHQIQACTHGWSIVDYSNATVIEKLTASLGVHLDEQYPLWERSKHAGEGNYILWSKTEGGLSAEETARKAYIDSIYAWITQCRLDRDTREAALLNDGTFPSFVWTPRP